MSEGLSHEEGACSSSVVALMVMQPGSNYFASCLAGSLLSITDELQQRLLGYPHGKHSLWVSSEHLGAPAIGHHTPEAAAMNRYVSRPIIPSLVHGVCGGRSLVTA